MTRCWNPFKTPKVKEKIMENYSVHPKCELAWSKLYQPSDFQGEVCLCGHPMAAHNGMCDVGRDVCLCTDPNPVIEVSDTRYFFRSTKGPHEAHALVLGVSALMKNGGSVQIDNPWRCFVKECSSQAKALPVRMRTGNVPTLKLSVNDANKLLCSSCLEAMLMP
jgi:hypothetical protein